MTHLNHSPLESRLKLAEAYLNVASSHNHSVGHRVTYLLSGGFHGHSQTCHSFCEVL